MYERGEGKIMRKYNKGQALVEFALVLPFFLLLVFGIIYSGMLFYDYSTLSNVARSAARERAITKTSTEDSVIIKNYFNNGDFIYGQTTSLYRPGTPPMIIETNGDDIVVTINMQLGERTPLMEMVLPDHYSIVYHMRKDYKEAANPTQ